MAGVGARGSGDGEGEGLGVIAVHSPDTMRTHLEPQWSHTRYAPVASGRLAWRLAL